MTRARRPELGRVALGRQIIRRRSDTNLVDGAGGRPLGSRLGGGGGRWALPLGACLLLQLRGAVVSGQSVPVPGRSHVSQTPAPRGKSRRQEQVCFAGKAPVQ